MEHLPETEAQLARLRRGDESAIAPLLKTTHSLVTSGDYEQALTTLIGIVTYTVKHSENERAVVVQSIAVASKLAQQEALFQAARILKLGAQYCTRWPEQIETVALAELFVDVARANRDFPAAREAIGAIGACGRLGSGLHKRALNLALLVRQEEIGGK